MKTLLNLKDDLVARAKALATRERNSLTCFIEEGLALWLSGHRTRATAAVALPVSKRKGGLRRGVDGTSNRSMFDAADA